MKRNCMKKFVCCKYTVVVVTTMLSVMHGRNTAHRCIAESGAVGIPTI